MKKLLLCASALLLSLGFSKAQGWSTTGAHDDFASTTSYANGPNGEGINWWENTGGATLTVTRGTGSMTVSATNAGGCNTASASCYPLLGVDFGNNGTGTVDLTAGANISLDIENTSSDDVFIAITLEDINSHMAGVEPNISDVKDTSTYGYAGIPTNHYRRKALNGFTLAAGDRQTITIDLSSVPGAIGGLTAVSYSGCATGPYYCPTTSYTLDPSQIKDVQFLVNFGHDDINLSEGDGDPTLDTYVQGTTITPFNGDIKIYDFKIGTFVAGLNKASVVNSSLSIYPNPADEAFIVSFDADNGADVSLSDMIGTKVFSTSANAGSNKITVNTSGLSSGVYILNIATENGTVARKVTIK